LKTGAAGVSLIAGDSAARAAAPAPGRDAAAAHAHNNTAAKTVLTLKAVHS
jgi:hypothetical protein